MLRLFDFAASGNCYKVRLLLAQLGVEYERVPVDLFAGETMRPEYLALNPAGRTPVLVTEEGEAIAESNAILLHLAEGTAFMPAGAIDRARVWQWLFFEQNLLEPNVGTARFWTLTGRGADQPQVLARCRSMGESALAALDRGLRGKRFLVTDTYSVADVSLFAYTHAAGDVFDLSPFTAVVEWIDRVQQTPAFMDDLAPYPGNAGPAGVSVHG